MWALGEAKELYKLDQAPSHITDKAYQYAGAGQAVKVKGKALEM